MPLYQLNVKMNNLICFDPCSSNFAKNVGELAPPSQLCQADVLNLIIIVPPYQLNVKMNNLICFEFIQFCQKCGWVSPTLPTVSGRRIKFDNYCATLPTLSHVDKSQNLRSKRIIWYVLIHGHPILPKIIENGFLYMTNVSP